jgi:hypothetical protein
LEKIKGCSVIMIHSSKVTIHLWVITTACVIIA